MTDKTLVYVIADYGQLHDLAFAEVYQQICAELEPLSATIKTFAVTPFDTVATGFFLAQTANNSRLGERHKFFVNTAPRKDDLAARTNNAGEGFAYARLKNGVEICVVNSGYSLSFIKEHAEEIRQINCKTDGTQFRSRDVFPPAFARICKGDYTQLGADIRDTIPDVPQNAVCYTDGYGNLKCAFDAAELAALKGKKLMVSINGVEQEVTVADGIFGVKDGEFVFSKGSSGWTLPGGLAVEFCEIVKRGGSAAERFNKPQGGAKVSYTVL
jgi:hypothetical protein